MDCPDDNTLAALVDRSIGSATLEALDGHIDTCERCRKVVALALGSNETVEGQRPAALAEIEHDPEGLIGQTIEDRYQVASLLGRGGMGTVYLARDVTLDRDVALKIHRAGTDDVRLKREAVAMAQLAHPNVVNVFEVGTIAAATYVAMEYVPGATLRVWLAATRRPWREIVEVLVDAGRGLAAAHAAGLVHRDFKPENVLVGDDDRPRVSDFGLARVAARMPAAAADPHAPVSIETLEGTVMGTPAYMAPEQFERSDVDAASDQFAFCVVAWECLYGKRPFGGATIAEVRSAIERHELDRVARSRVPDRVRRVLERGLALTPAERYPDMQVLLAELRRASAPRLARRATVAFVLIAAASGTVWAHGRDAADPCAAASLGASWNLPQRVRLEAAFLATGMPYAQGVWLRTQRALDQFAVRWGTQDRDACRAFDVAHTDDTALHARRTSCLDQGKLVFDAVVDRLGERSIVGTATTGYSLATRATQLVDALPDLETCVHPDNFVLPVEPASRANYIAFLSEVARISSLLSAGRIDEAARGLAAVTRLAKTLDSKRAEARIAFLTGHIAEVQHRNAEAEKAFETALWTAEATGYDELVAAAAVELLHTLGTDARDADAQRFRELARAASERVGSATARGRAARAIGQADLVAGRYDAAERELNDALALARSRVPVDEFDVGVVLVDLGDLYYRRGQAAKAEPVQREAIELFARSSGPDDPALGTAYDGHGNSLADLGRYDEATAAYAKALAIRERALGPDHPEVASTLNNASGVAMQAGRFDEARRDLEHALAIDQRILDPFHPSIGHILFNLGEVARLQDAAADATRFHTRALELRRKRLGDHHPAVAETYLALAEDAFAQHDPVGASRACELARSTIAGSDVKNPELAAGVETCAGTALFDMGQPSRAVPLLEHALALHRESQGDPGELAAIELRLARALPASASTRAIELVKSARTAFEREGALYRHELALADAWLRDHAK